MINLMTKVGKNDALFTISVASELVGLHPRTLMLYEKNNLVKPQRTSTGRRRYSQLDLEKIRFIHYLAKEKKINLSGIGVLFSSLKAVGVSSFEAIRKLFPDHKN